MNKAVKLSAHLQALGIQAEKLLNHPLQKIGCEKWWLWKASTESIESLGFFQVTVNDIAFINLIREVPLPPIPITGGGYINYYVEYLIPLKDMPSSLCWATLESERERRFRSEVVDIKWQGGTLADKLNCDLDLKQSLLMELQMNSWLGIEIAPEPAYQCARIETSGITERGWLGRLGGLLLCRLSKPVLRLPSVSLFNCLGRIAEHVMEIRSRTERPLLKAKIELNLHSKKTGAGECQVTDQNLFIESKELMKIPLHRIRHCDIRDNWLNDMYAVDYSIATSTIKVIYLDESGRSQALEFEMSMGDAASLREALLYSYPLGISR